MKKLVIGHLFPELLNLYGDLGNITTLVKRCQWRGIEAEVIEYTIGEEIPFEELDIILLGGGSDREQRLVGDYLKSKEQSFKKYVEEGKVVLAICGGYQLLGSHYATGKTSIPGLGVLDMYTERQDERLVGNVVVKGVIDGQTFDIVGFTNHGGLTYHKGTPLGRVVVGYGNNATDDLEGLVYKHTVGTYLHGPLLPKNPELADILIKWALEKKYSEEIVLDALDDTYEMLGKESMLKRLQKGEIKN